MAASTTWPHPEGEQHPAAAEVAEQVERRHRWAAGRPDRV
jgi:hypothetical protein